MPRASLTVEADDAKEEQRFVTIGMNVFGSLMVVVHTPRGEGARTISVRKPNPKTWQRTRPKPCARRAGRLRLRARFRTSAQIEGCNMAGQTRKPGVKMKKVPLAEIKDDLSRYLREAAKSEIVITRHGKPAGVLIGFESEDDWFDYRLENDPRFLQRIERARESLRAGRGVKLENVK